MKKSLLALAALGMFAGAAHAQSTVTLYGIVDIGIAYTSNSNAAGKSTWAMASGNESGSRWGLTGAEDLGGGLKAIFKLENGFNPNNGSLGQGGRQFGRQAYVGLSGNFGSVTMGRQYNAIQDFVAPTDVASALTQYATHPYDNDNLNNSFRSDNSVKYTSPKIAGFQAEALYGFSNGANFANNRTYSLGASYAMGPLNLGAGYARAQNPFANSAGSLFNSAGTPNPYPFGGNRIDQWGLGGTYAFGPATVGLLYTGSLFSNATGGLTATGGSIHFNNYEGSFRFQLTPALVLAVGETYTGVRQAGVSGHFWQTNLGADYNLSKRTDVYLSGAYQKASKNLNAAIDASAGTASGRSQTLVVAGIRHKF
ncbi:MAG: porin [Trinickia sp.]|uniref:porin n=1 Tax=Trinickia sp. TaxID=2571163 RepID=UPI003F7E3D7E